MVEPFIRAFKKRKKKFVSFLLRPPTFQSTPKAPLWNEAKFIDRDQLIVLHHEEQPQTFKRQSLTCSSFGPAVAFPEELMPFTRPHHQIRRAAFQSLIDSSSFSHDWAIPYAPLAL